MRYGRQRLPRAAPFWQSACWPHFPSAGRSAPLTHQWQSSSRGSRSGCPTDARYTKRVWTGGEVKQLVVQYGVEQVVFFPRGFEPKHSENCNQQLWNELLAG